MKSHLLALTAISLTGVASAAQNDSCPPVPPASCYSADDCQPMYCLGPNNYGVNAPVRPKTCDGDVRITVAGFYWNAHEDGMEYAIKNNVAPPTANAPNNGAIEPINNIIDAEYKNPNFDWDFGFKFGLGYNTIHDGWDINVLWTWYRGKANGKVEAESDDNAVLLPIWSAFAPAQGNALYATDIEHHWKLDLNLVDIELGREFWTSKYLSFRPFVGLRIAYIEQEWDLEHKGGSWSVNLATASGQTVNLNNYVDIDNDFKGVGLRSGFDTVWNFGAGWGFFGNLAASILYGRFHIEHDEYNRTATFPHSKQKVLETHESFRSSRAIVDFAAGIQWSTMFSQCRYGFTAMLGWENHLFFDQNQMWRVNRIGDDFVTDTFPNNTGENVYYQRRGTLDTQGWTLTFVFEF